MRTFLFLSKCVPSDLNLSRDPPLSSLYSVKALKRTRLAHLGGDRRRDLASGHDQAAHEAGACRPATADQRAHADGDGRRRRPTGDGRPAHAGGDGRCTSLRWSAEITENRCAGGTREKLTLGYSGWGTLLTGPRARWDGYFTGYSGYSGGGVRGTLRSRRTFHRRTRRSNRACRRAAHPAGVLWVLTLFSIAVVRVR